MRDGAELISEEFFPLFRNVVTSLIKEQCDIAPIDKDATAINIRRRLSGRQRLVISR